MTDRAPTTYLFDLDGTLIDSIELIMSSFRHTMREHVGEVPSDDVWLRGLGTPLWKQFRTFTDDEGEVERMVATYRAHNLANHDGLIRHYPGVREMLEALRAQGRPMGIVTSKKREGSYRGIDLMEMRDFFSVVVTADDVDRHKPDPAPVRMALDLLDADPTTTVFVGDSPHDVRAGHAAGVTTAAALWGPFPRDWLEACEPDHWLERPGDLLRLPSAA